MFCYICLLSYNVSSARLFGWIDIIFAACMMHFNNFYYSLPLNQARSKCFFFQFGFWQNTCKQLYFVLNISHYNLLTYFWKFCSLSTDYQYLKHFQNNQFWCRKTVSVYNHIKHSRSGSSWTKSMSRLGNNLLGLLLSSAAISSPTSANNLVNNVFITNRNKVCNYKNKMLIIINLQSSFK